MAQLVVIEGANRGAVYPLFPQNNRLGRDAELEVMLPDEQISRVHAEISSAADGFRLADLGSRNGTFLNGVRCEHAALLPGDTIRLGGVRLLFCEDAAVAGNRLLQAGLSTLHAATAERSPGEPLAGPVMQPRELLGDSPEMREVTRRIFKAAAAPGHVLICGESGTGKELVARAVHRNSPRRGGPFIAINAALLSGQMLHSELFGHEKGAFTGAVALRKGAFELGGCVVLGKSRRCAGVPSARIEDEPLHVAGKTRTKQ